MATKTSIRNIDTTKYLNEGGKFGAAANALIGNKTDMTVKLKSIVGTHPLELVAAPVEAIAKLEKAKAKAIAADPAAAAAKPKKDKKDKKSVSSPAPKSGKKKRSPVAVS